MITPLVCRRRRCQHWCRCHGRGGTGSLRVRICPTRTTAHLARTCRVRMRERLEYGCRPPCSLRGTRICMHVDQADAFVNMDVWYVSFTRLGSTGLWYQMSRSGWTVVNLGRIRGIFITNWIEFGTEAVEPLMSTATSNDSYVYYVISSLSFSWSIHRLI
jgi:hypothetical protein